MAIIGRAFPALGRRFLVFWSGKRQWTFEIRSVLHGKYILIFNILNILNIYSMKKKMCELPSPLLPHLQPHKVITKAWLHGHSSVYYSLVSLTAAIAFKSTKKEQMGDRAKPLNTENENILTAAFPRTLHHFRAAKAMACSSVARTDSFDSFQDFLFQAQILVPSAKETPKTPDTVQWGHSCAYCSETEQEPVLNW